jgi:hypothetical protein
MSIEVEPSSPHATPQAEVHRRCQRARSALTAPLGRPLGLRRCGEHDLPTAARIGHEPARVLRAQAPVGRPLSRRASEATRGSFRLCRTRHRFDLGLSPVPLQAGTTYACC